MKPEKQQKLSQRFKDFVRDASGETAEFCQQYRSFSACRNCFQDDRSEPVAKEGRSIKFLNKCRKELLLRRLDGCCMPIDRKKCDYIAIEDDSQSCWLIEFKGSSYADACHQLVETFEFINSKSRLFELASKLIFVVVMTSGKSVTISTRTSSSVSKLEKLKTQLKGRGIETDIIKREREVQINLC